jgi:hypothetical protein
VTGLHAIEAPLFGAQRMDIRPETDALIFHLTGLRVKIRDTRLTGQGLLNALSSPLPLAGLTMPLPDISIFAS